MCEEYNIVVDLEHDTLAVNNCINNKCIIKLLLKQNEYIRLYQEHYMYCDCSHDQEGYCGNQDRPCDCECHSIHKSKALEAVLLNINQSTKAIYLDELLDIFGILLGRRIIYVDGDNLLICPGYIYKYCISLLRTIPIILT